MGQKTRARRRTVGARASAFCLAGALALAAAAAAAQQQGRANDARSGVLGRCTAHSSTLDELHACLDGYLDTLDERLTETRDEIESLLDGDALAAFRRSRGAFDAYRRENCLWYLAFSSPREEAEQIAKNCLATMSLERLAELRRLLSAGDANDAILAGYYVYGEDRNTFRPCGSSARYWVEGDATVVGALQQSYVEAATEERQLLFASLRGALDENAQTVSGHDGVLRATAVFELRAPREGDCRDGLDTLAALDDAAPPESPSEEVEAVPVAAVEEEEAPASDGAADQDEPEQQLVAYFGAWTADCVERGERRGCTLSVAFGEGGAPGTPRLLLARGEDAATRVELRFPEREIDSPAKVRWSVDEEELGDVLGSEVRVDSEGTRLIVETEPFLGDELLPRMIAGSALAVEVRGAVDDDEGERFVATLMGLTRALTFADDFIAAEGA